MHTHELVEHEAGHVEVHLDGGNSDSYVTVAKCEEFDSGSDRVWNTGRVGNDVCAGRVRGSESVDWIRQTETRYLVPEPLGDFDAGSVDAEEQP